MSKILLILGAGPNIGGHVAKAFSSQGYKVACASRSAPKFDKSTYDLHIPADFAKPETVPGIFETVREKLGGEPGVVVYNASIWTRDPTNPLDLFTPTGSADFQNSQAINVISALSSLNESIKSFRNTAADASKTFIFTGNILSQVTMPGGLSFGLGKADAAYAIRHMVEQGKVKDEGVKIYYTDERKTDGKAVYGAISGEAAAEAYWDLAERKDQGPWLYTFVKGEGYKDFSAKFLYIIHLLKGSSGEDLVPFYVAIRLKEADIRRVYKFTAVEIQRNN